MFDLLPQLHALLVIRADAVARYRDYMANEPTIGVRIVSSIEDARTELADRQKPTDILVVDNTFQDAFNFIKAIRMDHPRLMVLLVDEDADFSTPGPADDVTTDPFQNGEIIRKIRRLLEDRRLETIRADALPPIRNFAKALAKATKGLGRMQAAVGAVQELGFAHVAYYTVEGTPPTLSLSAQVGDNAVMSAMPQKPEPTGLMADVLTTGKSRVGAAGTPYTHFLLEKGKYGAAVCLAVGQSMRFGLILAFKEGKDSIAQESVMMVELICAQLAAALAKERQS